MNRSSVCRSLVGAIAVVVQTAFVGAERPADLVNRHVRAQVVGVVDGDTVDVVIAPARRVRVRLHGVDAPERREPFSQQARNFTRVFMLDREVNVMGRDVDRYDRLVARILVDGRDASEAILSAGLACHSRRYSDDAALEAAEQRARAAALGFWARGTPQPACVAREAEAMSTATTPSREGVRPKTP